MKILKALLIFTAFFLLGFIVFYLWASSPSSNKIKAAEVHYFSNTSNVLPDTFDVITYNIGYMSGMTNNLAVERPISLIEKNLKESISLLREMNPHIIAFQEIDFASSRSYQINQFERLAHSLDYQAGATAINWNKNYVPFPYWPFKYHFGKTISGQAVLSRTHILSNQRVVLPFPESNTFFYNDFYLDRLLQMCWLQNGADSILIMNVHFEAWDAPTRELQSKIVSDVYLSYEKDHPILLLGDFNCIPPFEENGEQEQTIRDILDLPNLKMVTKQEDYHSQPIDFFTFNSEHPYQKIDYIFYNNRYIDCLDYRVLHEAGSVSDHLPLYARLRFKSFH